MYVLSTLSAALALIQPPRFSAELAHLQGVWGTGATGLEPATSAVTGQRSNQLSYAPRLHGEMAPALRAHAFQYAKGLAIA
jgi:hypothetical protein